MAGPWSPDGKERALEDREVRFQRLNKVQTVGRRQRAGDVGEVRPPDYHGTPDMGHFLSKVGPFFVDVPPLGHSLVEGMN